MNFFVIKKYSGLFVRLYEMWISTDLENRKISRVFFHFISCQAQTKMRELHQEIVALEHCTATESAVLYPTQTVNKASPVHCLGVGLCVGLGSVWVPYLGEPQICIDSDRVCVEADALSVLLELWSLPRGSCGGKFRHFTRGHFWCVGRGVCAGAGLIPAPRVEWRGARSRSSTVIVTVCLWRGWLSIEINLYLSPLGLVPCLHCRSCLPTACCWFTCLPRACSHQVVRIVKVQ